MATANFKSEAHPGRNFCRNGSEYGLPLSAFHHEGTPSAPSLFHAMPCVLVIKNELSELHRVEIFLRCLEIDLKSYAKRNDSRCDLTGLAEVARTAADLIGGVQGRFHAIRLLSLPVDRSNNFGEVAHG